MGISTILNLNFGYLQEEENLGQLRWKAQDSSDHPSGILCHAESLTKPPTTTVLLHEFDKVAEGLDSDKILILYEVCQYSSSLNHNLNNTW
jgi:hypothetical protein